MRRVVRHLFTILSTLSLLLCIASAVFWARSYEHPFFLFYDWLQTREPVQVRSVYCKSDNGAIRFTADRTIAQTRRAADSWYSEPRGFRSFQFTRSPPLRGPWDGFEVRSLHEESKNVPVSVVVHSVGVPYWFATLLLAALPAMWFHLQRTSWRRTRRERAGLCPACGYDLRESPERCPECGAANPSRASARVAA